VTSTGRSILAAFAIVATILALWWLSGEAPAPRDAGPVREDVAAAGAATPPGGTRAPARPRADESPLDYGRQFELSPDLATFADDMSKLSREGDDAGQFWLYRALRECGDHYDEVFDGDRAGARAGLSLEEALAKEQAAPRLGAAEIVRLHGRCGPLRGIDWGAFGATDELLRDAARSGYPLAQAWLANRLLLEHSPTTPEADPIRDQARALVLQALRSRDPDVLLMTADNSRLLSRTESARERHEWTWEVAACLRGADCSPAATWVRRLCAQDKRCQPHETGVDLIRRRVGAQMPEIEEAARAINAHVDAGEWDRLGL
jgi:hypothetical protein